MPFVEIAGFCNDFPPFFLTPRIAVPFLVKVPGFFPQIEISFFEIQIKLTFFRLIGLTALFFTRSPSIEKMKCDSVRRKPSIHAGSFY